MSTRFSINSEFRYFGLIHYRQKSHKFADEKPRFIAVTEFTAHYCNPIKNKTKHLPEHFKHFREIVSQCVCVYLYVVYHAP